MCEKRQLFLQKHATEKHTENLLNEQRTRVNKTNLHYRQRENARGRRREIGRHKENKANQWTAHGAAIKHNFVHLMF